jgi:hypothetical protein
VFVRADEGGCLEAFVARALASTSKAFLPTFGRISSYLFSHYRLLPLGASREEINLCQYERLRDVVRLANQTKFYKKKFQKLDVDVNKVERVSDLKLKVRKRFYQICKLLWT